MDWMETPLEDFFGINETQEDGTVQLIVHPHGDGVAQRLMVSVQMDIHDAYENLLSEPDGERYELAGEVPVIRDGHRVYQDVRTLTLRDMPAILDTLAMLEDEARAMAQEEKERLDVERKRRRNARERERRKRKGLGEW